ncbi:unannotated protein [freshwater metagenome]|uniref:Unannotated protein n=1 Tax=freshwater metagenome TaxID=449393 RepID=A0A6J6SFZ8_9ZZZZ
MLVHLHADLGQRVLDGQGGHRAGDRLAAGDLEGQGLRGDHLEGGAGAVQRAATAQRQVGVAVAATDLLERTGDGRGRDPVGLLGAVDAEREGATEEHRDTAAVLDGLVEVGGDDVVGADLDALRLEDLGDGAAHRADLLGAAVEGQGDRAGQRAVPQGGAGDREDHGGGQCGHEGSALAGGGQSSGQPAGEPAEVRAHRTPYVVLPGPRVPARCGVPARSGGHHTWCVHRRDIVPDPGRQCSRRTAIRSSMQTLVHTAPPGV